MYDKAPLELIRLEDVIQDSLLKAGSLKGVAGIDIKWLNKTIARLEEAQVFAAKATGAGFHQIAVPLNDSEPKANCTCPNGAVDRFCPVHGEK